MGIAGFCAQDRIDVENGRHYRCNRPRTHDVVQEAGAQGEYFMIAQSGAPLYCRACATLQAWALNKEIKLNGRRTGRYPERRLKAL